MILVCNSPSKIIEPVRSRCLAIRVPCASPEDISNVLLNVCKKENFQCPPEVTMKMAIQSDLNIRRALLMLETSRMQQGSTANAIIPIDYQVQLPDWELYIYRITKEMLQEQSPAKIMTIRDMFYELLTNCIPADVIIKTMVQELCKSLDDTLKHEVVYWAAYYDNRCAKGSKDIFHLEAFVVKFMSLYKQWLISLFG